MLSVETESKVNQQDALSRILYNALRSIGADKRVCMDDGIYKKRVVRGKRREGIHNARR